LISENLTTYGLFLKALKRRRNVDEKQEPAKKLMRFRERRIAANIAKAPPSPNALSAMAPVFSVSRRGNQIDLHLTEFQ
jgi:hypothetical protein